ncbi:LysR family transcriptional regulator [Acidocella facilis]|uniref:LysR substrate-binding domain-containing protein n=1 Tax=Acidocella facilis TaxID=525 RepID=UPI002E192FB4
MARRVDLRHMWYAVTTARHRSMRQAAAMLNVRQATLSRAIHDFEEEIGISLFERSAAGASPTQAGQKFLYEIENILERIDNMVAAARSTRRGDAGRLTIGFSTSLSAGNLRVTLIEFARHFPHVEINAIEGSRARLFLALENGHIDIAIVTGDPPALYKGRTMPLWTERVIIALPEVHPLAFHEIVQWTDLKGEKLLISHHQPIQEIQDILISKLASSEDLPNLVLQDVSRGDIQNLVAVGFGVSLMCEAAVVHCPGVAYREARDGAGPTRVVYTGSWQDTNGNPVLKNFIKLLEERFPPLPSSAAEKHGK